ncbi:hypothetical protein VNO78_01402 [Psophocarpus tetragonolobus]|uniref:Uncharacterized protein n=1 Tax=Psophocarpus tetragonolobus TaxID=3891 RepID=A0AAN9SXY3_PSOTE
MGKIPTFVGSSLGFEDSVKILEELTTSGLENGMQTDLQNVMRTEDTTIPSIYYRDEEVNTQNENVVVEDSIDQTDLNPTGIKDIPFEEAVKVDTSKGEVEVDVDCSNSRKKKIKLRGGK